MKAAFRERLERMEGHHPAILAATPAFTPVLEPKVRPVRGPQGRDALIPADLREMIEEKKRSLRMPFTRLYLDGDGDK